MPVLPSGFLQRVPRRIAVSLCPERPERARIRPDRLNVVLVLCEQAACLFVSLLFKKQRDQQISNALIVVPIHLQQVTILHDRLIDAAGLVEDLSQREACPHIRSCLELLPEGACLVEPLPADRSRAGINTALIPFERGFWRQRGIAKNDAGVSAVGR